MNRTQAVAGVCGLLIAVCGYTLWHTHRTTKQRQSAAFHEKVAKPLSQGDEAVWLVQQFLKAPTVDEKLAYLQGAEGVRGLLMTWLQRHGSLPQEAAISVVGYSHYIDSRGRQGQEQSVESATAPQTVAAVANGGPPDGSVRSQTPPVRLTRVRVETATHPSLAFVVEHGSRPEDARIEWGISTGESDFDWDLGVPLTRYDRPFTVRAVAQFDTYYNYSFQDEKKWLNVRLEAPQRGQMPIHAYVQLKSAEADELARILQKTGRPQSVRLTVKLTRVKGSGPRQFLFHSLANEGWRLSESQPALAGR